MWEIISILIHILTHMLIHNMYIFIYIPPIILYKYITTKPNKNQILKSRTRT